MKSRFLLLYILFLTGTHQLLAQGPPMNQPIGRISGKVVDAGKNTPLEYSSVTIQSLKDSSLLMGSLVDEKGFFEITKIPFGAYKLTISYVGYKDFVQQPVLVIPPDKMDVALGTLKVEEDAKVLQEVQITAEKSFMQLNAEKKIFNMEKNTISAGGTAIDALKQVPMVEVDQDGNLSMRGSGNLRVFINGKPSGITINNTKAILDAIPASQIESIEIINNPSAKYDAEGEVGIINIQLKKNTKVGLNGTFTVGYATKYDANTGVSINFRKNNISFSSNYSFRFNEGFYKGNSNRYNFPGFISPYYLNTSDRGTFRNINNTLSANLDWDIKEKNTWSFNALGSYSPGFSDGLNNITFLDSAVNFVNKIQRYTDAKNNNWNAEVTTTYRRVFKDKSNDLVLTGNYARTFREGKPEYTQYEVDENDITLLPFPFFERNTNGSYAHTGYVQGDFTQPFEKAKGKFETGYKFSARSLVSDLFADSLDNASQTFITNLGLTNSYDYREFIHAAYVIWSQTVKKFSYKGGVRLENTQIRGTQSVGNITDKQSYFDYFPSASMSYKLPKNNDLQLAYSKRINRPTPEMLNPFGQYSDPYNILTGDPKTKPSYTHAVELTHSKSFKKGIFFSTTVYYRYATNVFTRYRVVDTAGRSIVSFGNLESGQNVGVEFTNRSTITKWWNLMVTANLFQNKIKGDVPNGETDASTNSFQYNFRIMNTFTFWKGASLQLMVNYRSKIKYLQGTIRPMVFASLGFRKDFLKDNRASIAVNINDIFNTMYFGISNDGSTFSSTTNRYWESTVGSITFSYRFGKSDAKPGMPGKKKSNFEDSGSGVEGGGG